MYQRGRRRGLVRHWYLNYSYFPYLSHQFGLSINKGKRGGESERERERERGGGGGGGGGGEEDRDALNMFIVRTMSCTSGRAHAQAGISLIFLARRYETGDLQTALCCVPDRRQDSYFAVEVFQ